MMPLGPRRGGLTDATHAAGLDTVLIRVRALFMGRSWNLFYVMRLAVIGNVVRCRLILSCRIVLMLNMLVKMATGIARLCCTGPFWGLWNAGLAS